MVVSMATITVLITVQVILRYVFNESLAWAEELTRFIVIWMSFIGAGMGVRVGRHISVDLIASLASEKSRRVVVAAAALSGLIFAVTLFVYGGRLFLHAMSTGQVSSAMRLPMYYVYFIFPLSATLLAIRFGQLALCQLRGGSGSGTASADITSGV